MSEYCQLSTVAFSYAQYTIYLTVPSVIVGLEQSSFTVIEGGVINVCVFAKNDRYMDVEVLVYLHIEGE